MGDSSFTEEQLAIAKKLQAGYCSSGTFRSQAASQPASSRPQPAAQPARVPVLTQPVRGLPVSQPVRGPPMPANRPSNGLIRPLPSRDIPPRSVPAASVVRTGHASSTTGASQAPPKPPPVVPATQPVTQSKEPPRGNPYPTTSIPQTSYNTDILKNAFCTAAEERPATSAAFGSSGAQNTTSLIRAPEVVRQAININKMGKPIKWNYMTEAPAVRELNPEEIEEPEPLPSPDPSEKMPWIRAWHPNEPMKVPGLGDGAMDVDESHPVAARPTIGLKGSRHNN